MPLPMPVLVDLVLTSTASPRSIAHAIAALGAATPGDPEPPRLPAGDLMLQDLDPSRLFAPEPTPEPVTATLKCSGSGGRKNSG